MLPYTRIVIQSQYSVDETRRIVEDLVEPLRSWKQYVLTFRSDHKPFEGIVSSETFDVQPVIRYRTPFVPLFRGRFRVSESGTPEVALSARLHPLVTIFLTAWLCLVALSTVYLLVNEQSGVSKLDSVLHGGVMFLIVSCACVGNFSLLARRSCTILQKALHKA